MGHGTASKTRLSAEGEVERILLGLTGDRRCIWGKLLLATGIYWRCFWVWSIYGSSTWTCDLFGLLHGWCMAHGYVWEVWVRVNTSYVEQWYMGVGSRFKVGYGPCAFIRTQSDQH